MTLEGWKNFFKGLFVWFVVIPLFVIGIVVAISLVGWFAQELTK